VTALRIAVIGAGAMGGMFGARFADAGAEVVLIDRDAPHVTAILTDGLAVDCQGQQHWYRLPATTDPAGLGVFDLALVMVDCNATHAAAETAGELIGATGAALTLQNGIGNIETLVEVLGTSRVLAGSTMNSAARTGPGRIAHTHLGKTVLGELDGSTTPRLEAVAELFGKALLPVEITANIQGHVWQKFVLNAALNPVSAITRLRPGEIADSAAASDLVHRILDEVLAVVAAEGIELPDPDPRGSILGHAVGRMNKPSMLQHVEQGRRTEIAALNGALLGHAARHGIDCPVNATIVQLVKAIEARPTI
jgi:2-dehydropantoate 2-reductase